MLFLILLFIPLFNCFIAICGIYSGKRYLSMVLIIHSYLLLCSLTCWAVFNVCIKGGVYYFTLGKWISCGSFYVSWGFMFDPLSTIMVWMVSVISGCVHFYSWDYMKNDLYNLKFMAYLSLFTFFMFILVTADNFVQLFLGWEGIGVCSFLLISFWNSRVQAIKSATKALIINRIGDAGFLFAIVLIFYFFRSVDFSIIFSLAYYFNYTSINVFSFNFLILDLIGIFLFIGSIGKSAQIGLHVWLPDAMEGPTPVSALIHAATLVTAGIFLVVRCSIIYEHAKLALFLIALLGGVTCIFGASLAISQYDIKKIIAYSTCSQLGYMFLICGFSRYDVSMFHLINHAFFKALLFLCAGSIIHSMGGEQDIRKYGLLLKVMPISYISMLIGSIALSGVPYFSGFYSKDLIIEISAFCFTVEAIFCHWLSELAVVLTAFYSFRIIWFTFFNFEFNGFKYSLQKQTEASKGMQFSFLILSLGSIFSGYLMEDALTGLGSIFWGNSIYKSENPHSIIINELYFFIYIQSLPIYVKELPLIFSILGIVFSFMWDYFFENKFIYFIKLRHLSLHKFYFDFIYNYFIGYFILVSAYSTFYKLFDKGLFEYIGPKGVSYFVYVLVTRSLKFQSGLLCHNILLILLGGFYLIIFLYIF